MTHSMADDESLPEAVVTRALALTRRIREAVDDDERAAYRGERDDLLADHGYAPRVREIGRAHV